MRRDKTDEITICSNGVGGSGDKGSRLGRHPKYVYKPLFPPLVLESFLLVCCENLSELRPPLE